MCGIAGYFNSKNFRKEHLESMLARISHRGPDGEGFTWFSARGIYPAAGRDTPENCKGDALPWLAREELPHEIPGYFGGFGHRRLAIVDLEAGGHQPMCSPDGRFWIAFNGEIYNHPELRELLRKEGYDFRTRSDTEVILAAYRHWGSDCLSRFNGMWAFAIYDSREEKIFAARDRFGVKPFYYYQREGIFLFASEQKALLENPELKTGLNESAVFDYFVFGQIEYQHEGFFLNILELPPSHYLEWDRRSGKTSISRYYRLRYVPDREKGPDMQEATAHTRELLQDAIRLRMRADVEVGTCLSGGLDSSAIAGFMREIAGYGADFKCFTAVFPGKRFDESKWASQMAEFSKAKASTVSPKTEELIEDLDELSLCQDIPIWSTSTYAQFRVMKLVRDSGIKVVLDGQGGDEVFAGYGQHLYFYRKGLPFGEKLRSLGSVRDLAYQVKQQIRFETIYKLPPALASKVFRQYFPDLGLLQPEFYGRNRERFLDMRSSVAQCLNSRLAAEMENTSLKAYLKCEDRCAMWFGVESRTPFADDHPLIDYVFSLPADLKMNTGQQKILLREAIRGIVPEEIRLRKDKLGYATPNNAWIRELAPQLRDSFQDNLGHVLQIDKIRRDYKEAFSPSGEIDKGRIFKFFSFARWHAIFGHRL